MADVFIGEIRVFACNFAPVGWAFCDGQLLPLSQNTALFSLLGVQYGGNGTSNFALPDLRGRASIGSGNGTGLTPRTQGETGGSETIVLALPTMPAHVHVMSAGGALAGKNSPGDSQSPAGRVPAVEASGVTATYSKLPPDAQMTAGGVTFSGSAVVGNTGGGQAHENRQPYSTLNFCIALQGIYPSRP